MHKSRIVLLCGVIALAACQQEQPQPQPVDTTPPASTVVAADEATPAARPVAGALKSELPEGFMLPFPFHRLYDNTGKTETGAHQRRILVEYLDLEAPAVESALIQALQGKGFTAPATSAEGAATELTFARADGASVVVKITPGRDNPRAPNAMGILHLVWNAG